MQFVSNYSFFEQKCIGITQSMVHILWVASGTLSLLNGKEYAVSLAYDATREHINDIYDFLMKVKAIINQLISTTK